MENARKIAEALLDVEALRLRPHQPFLWSSGWKSPVYCDNRLTLSYPDVRNLICEAFRQKVEAQFAAAEAICGVATGGLPHGMLLADRLKLPFLYVRPSPKGHGLLNQVEGRIQPEQRVVVVEDLVSTGESSLKAIRALREAGLRIEGLVSIFHYGFEQAERTFRSEGVVFVPLCTFDVLLSVALVRGIMDEATAATVRTWRTDPANWQAPEPK